MTRGPAPLAARGLLRAEDFAVAVTYFFFVALNVPLGWIASSAFTWP
jgi:hypothetical protein